MTQSPVGATSFYAVRAEQLALIYLTRRNDLQVIAELTDPKSAPPDIIVNIANVEHENPRRFAVEVKARLDASHRNDVLRDVIQQEYQKLTLGIPMCLFFFSMKNDEGFYTWLVEPVVTKNGTPVLLPSKYQVNSDRQHRFEKLTDHAIDEIVKKVDEWYDLKYQIKNAISIAVPISKKKFASMVTESNQKEIDIDRSFPDYVEEIQSGLDDMMPPNTFQVIPLDGMEDNGQEIMTADRGAVQVVDKVVLDVWNRRHQWITKRPSVRSRGI